MTKQQFRESKEYKELMEKIEKYPKGFEFTLNYASIPKAKANALKVLTNDSISNGVLESIEIGLSLEGDFVEEKYRRL